MINLLGSDAKKQIRAARLNVVLMTYCAWGAVTILCILGIFGIGFWLTANERSLAQSQRVQNEQMATQYSDTRSQAQSFANDLVQARSILNSNISFYDLITKLAAVVPNGVILSNLSLGTSGLNTPVAITGRARNYQDVVTLKNNLQSSGIFKSANLTNAASNPVDATTDPVGARYPISLTISATFSDSFKKGTSK